MLFRGNIAISYPTHKYVHSLGRMESFSTLKQVLHNTNQWAAAAADTNKLSDFMETRPSSEAKSRSATYEFPSILWNQEVYYRVHNSPPLVGVSSQKNPVHTIPSCFPKALPLTTKSTWLSLSFARFFSPRCVLYALPVASSLA
jgi:hypothetical protein